MQILALDTGSPTASVAVLAGDRLALRTVPQRESAAPLLGLIDACLEELGLKVADLDALVALAGPGSFTGLRVGLATVLGLHQGSGRPAGALSTHQVLAAAAPPTDLPVVAAVDAGRSEWFLQRFVAGEADSSPTLEPAAALREAPAALWIGFGLSTVDGLAGVVVESPPLAPVAARLVASGRFQLDPTTLVRPRYLREPALSAPRPPKRVGTG